MLTVVEALLPPPPPPCWARASSPRAAGRGGRDTPHPGHAPSQPLARPLRTLRPRPREATLRVPPPPPPSGRRGAVSARLLVWVSVFLGPRLQLYISACPRPSCLCVSVSLSAILCPSLSLLDPEVSSSPNFCLRIPVSLFVSLSLPAFLSPSLGVPVCLQFSPSCLLVGPSVPCLHPSQLAGATCSPDFHLLLGLWRRRGRRLGGPRATPCGRQGDCPKRTEDCVHTLRCAESRETLWASVGDTGDGVCHQETVWVCTTVRLCVTPECVRGCVTL